MSRARREREHAAQLVRQHRQAVQTAARYEAAAVGEKQIAAALLALMGIGWTLLVDRRWPDTVAANVDMILVGPGGVFVIDVKNWRHTPVVNHERLYAGDNDRHGEVTKLIALTGKVQDTLATSRLAPSAVMPVLAFAGKSVDTQLGPVRLLGVTELAPSLAGTPRRLTESQVYRITADLADAFPAYETPAVPDAAATPDPPAEELALFDADAVARAHHEAVRARPIEEWMTFLHPDQLKLVRRRYTGPARISGAAGTGKTVVGLHRAAWLAQHTTGKIFYVTFVRNLPRVHERLLARMAPTVADRIESCSLHAWALRLLKGRGVAWRPDIEAVRNCFNRAWARIRRTSVLARLEPNPAYWQEEIDHVIKGRAIVSLADYLQASRPGRRTALQRNHREAVWHLYTEYETLLLDNGVHDFADVLDAALAEIRREPVAPAYAAVIADEVQDLTLTGVRLLHALAGNKPNGLLLIGDSQQAVYPGGFRLTDAGIDIRGGRAEVLKVNYRNAANVLTAAMTVLDGHSFDDIDGSVVRGAPAVETAYPGGTVIRQATATHSEHDTALLTALTDHHPPTDGSSGRWGDTAVLCFRSQDTTHYRTLLTRAGIPVQKLEDYDGQPTDAVKIGTVFRAKGLEFKKVYLPRHDHMIRDAQRGNFADIDRIAVATRQLFVAMTRARDLLWLGTITSGNTGSASRRRTT